MSSTLNRINKRKKAIREINELNSNPNNLLIIHYSCESFYDIKDGRTPRITSIAVRYFNSAQTVSFSIHKVAEKNKVSLNKIEEHYDQLERKMLDEYFEFVRTHIQYTWMHWNMRDINYGFTAIEHRYTVLGGTPNVIPNDRKFDLARYLIDLYSKKYANHPRLKNLIELNGLSHMAFLAGMDEAKAFDNKEYIKLHQSTLRKVDIFNSIFLLQVDSELKTDSKRIDIYGLSIQGLLEMSNEIWIVRLITYLITLVLGSIIGVYIGKIIN